MSVPGAAGDPAEPRRRRIALAATVLVNAAFLAALVRLMHPGRPEPVAVRAAVSRDVMQARLIDASPLPAPPPAEAAVPARTAAAPARSAAQAAQAAPQGVASNRAAEASPVPSSPPVPTTRPAPAAAGTPRFFEIDGRARLPEAVADATETPFPQRPPVPAGRNPLAHRDVLPYEPTRFDEYFPPVRETLGGEFVRKASRQRTVRTSSGLQITCSWVLIFGGCTWGAAPAAPIEALKAMRVELPPPKPAVPDAGAEGAGAEAADAPDPPP